MDATTYALDIAKNVLQLHWVDMRDGEIHRKKLARAKVSDFFARLPPGRVAMEACGGAHHLGRLFVAHGHQVELLPASQIRAFVPRNKDDASDARGIWLAAQQSDIRRVAVKTVDQQAALSLHRMRSHWVQLRTATINALRGLLYEFGVVLPKGKRAGLRHLVEERAQIDGQLPPVMIRMMEQQLQALREMDQHVISLEKEIDVMARDNEAARHLRKMPGIGPLGATALAATLGDGAAWRNGREFACCLGLAPKHTGTGGKVRMGGISKRGDAYLRTLLIHGARNLVRVPEPPEWIARMLQRRPFNVVATAVAHKLARSAWAIVAHRREYDPAWKSTPPLRAAA